MSQGHAHARFRRALLTKNLKLIEAASRELQHVGLDDALRVLVVFAERRDARYERAAARFAARVTMERRLGLAEARYVLALAEALPRSPDAVTLLLRPTAADVSTGLRTVWAMAVSIGLAIPLASTDAAARAEARDTRWPPADAPGSSEGVTACPTCSPRQGPWLRQRPCGPALTGCP